MHCFSHARDRGRSHERQFACAEEEENRSEHKEKLEDQALFDKTRASNPSPERERARGDKKKACSDGNGGTLGLYTDAHALRSHPPCIWFAWYTEIQRSCLLAHQRCTEQ